MKRLLVVIMATAVVLVSGTAHAAPKKSPWEVEVGLVLNDEIRSQFLLLPGGPMVGMRYAHPVSPSTVLRMGAWLRAFELTGSIETDFPVAKNVSALIRYSRSVGLMADVYHERQFDLGAIYRTGPWDLSLTQGFYEHGVWRFSGDWTGVITAGARLQMNPVMSLRAGWTWIPRRYRSTGSTELSISASWKL